MSNDPYEDLNRELADCPADEWPEAPEPDDEEWFDEQEREAKQAYANLKGLLTSDERIKALLSAHYSTLGIHCGSQLKTPRP